jgi:hypothetical protein
VLDVRSRSVIGWAMESHLRTALVLTAFGDGDRATPPADAIHHSDQGCQYTSIACGVALLLQQHGAAELHLAEGPVRGLLDELLELGTC